MDSETLAQMEAAGFFEEMTASEIEAFLSQNVEAMSCFSPEPETADDPDEDGPADRKRKRRIVSDDADEPPRQRQRLVNDDNDSDITREEDSEDDQSEVSHISDSDDDVISISDDDELPEMGIALGRARRNQPQVNYQIPDEDDVEINDGEDRVREAFTSANLANFQTHCKRTTEEFRRRFFIRMTQNPTVQQMPLIDDLLQDPCMESCRTAKNQAMLRAIEKDNIPMVKSLIRAHINLKTRNYTFLVTAVQHRRTKILTIFNRANLPIDVEHIQEALESGQNGRYRLLTRTEGRNQSPFFYVEFV
jgi:hypothetical protein